MSNQEIILHALGRVRRRLLMHRAVYDGCVLIGLIAVGLLLWRVLVLLGSEGPALTALAILIAFLLGAAGVFLLVRNRFATRATLTRAAFEADQRAGLKDELKTAYWFIQHPNASAWTAAQIARAASSARALDPARLLPIRLRRSTLAAGAVSVALLAIAWFAPPLAHLSDAVAQIDSGMSASDARQVQQLRQLAVEIKDDDAQTAAKLEQALSTLDRRQATDEQKQRALAAAQQALEQRNLQAASTREGLYQLSEKLRGNKKLDAVADALQEGDARKAADLMRNMAAKDAAGKPAETGPPDTAPTNKNLEALLKIGGGRAGDESQQREPSAAAAKEAVDRLNKIAEQLDVQKNVNQASQSLQQLQLAVAQRSALSAGRFGQQAAQMATPSPEAGKTNMPGGTMYRAAAVAKANQASQQQEGTKAGSALGDAPSDPVLGKKTTRLEVQLRKEAMPNETQSDEESKSKTWFYAESKEQKSMLDTQSVAARGTFAEAQSTAPEGVAVRHRQIVKDYFMQLRQDPQQ
ncbi:MAG: hypothetical protein ABI612_20815 [Betaproteobacteria bacterium]